MNKMGPTFWKRKGVGARKGRMTELSTPKNYKGVQGWVLMTDLYPNKEFHNFEEFEAYDSKAKSMAEARKAKKTPKKTEETEE